MKTPLYIAAIVLCGLSALCSVLMWSGEQNTLAASILFGGFALGLEFCKFAFFPIAAKIKSILSAGLYLVAFVLLLASVVATVSLLETGVINNKSQARTSSDSYKIAKVTISSLEREINALQRVIEKDIELGYRKRAIEQREKLAAVKAEKLEAMRLMNNLELTPATGMISLFSTLGDMLNASADKVRFWVYLFIAVMIDVCGIICLILLSSGKSKKSKRVATVIAKHKETKQPQIAADIDEVKQDIKNGSYGPSPVVRRVMEGARIRHPKAKAAFDELLNDGTLVKEGRAYRLTGINTAKLKAVD